MRIEKTEQGKTKNGLRYYLFPRTGFGEQIAAVLVQRGANHLFWKGRDGEKICFPQGTAHFIEHKLFQQEWGDAFARFTQMAHLPMPLPMATGRFIILPVRINSRKI